jgi:hypothetical protein
METVFKMAAVTCLLASSGFATADVVKRTMPACVTEDLFDELTTYVTKGDKQGMAQLILSGQCTILEKGKQIFVISPGFMVATVRYNGTKLFTASEAVR